MSKNIIRLTETAIMIALGTILSVIKLVDLPYGGSITIAHMLPVILIAYRYGSRWGFCSGFVYGLLQLLLGMKNLSYATSFWAAVAIIVFDYLAAYSVVGIIGVFHKKRSQPFSITFGALFIFFLRYVCHVISGCTVWAGLSIPTAEAFIYSVVYNATYMIPEAIVTTVAALYLSNFLDFRSEHLTHLQKTKRIPLSAVIFGLVATISSIASVCILFGSLQDAESGVFTLNNLSSLPWLWLISFVIIALVCAIISTCLLKRKQNS